MTTSRKLALAGLVIAATTGYLAYLGASASWQYYLTADECLADLARLGETRLRVSGKIAPQSLAIAQDRRRADFALRGTDADLRVSYAGAVPDGLAENSELVVEGRLQGNLLAADKLITRCATKYRSPAREPPVRTAQRSPEDRS